MLPLQFRHSYKSILSVVFRIYVISGRRTIISGQVTETHQIVSKYHINAKEITTAFIVADHSVHIETSLDIYPKDAYLNGDAPNYFERRITYYVKPDGELYLASLSDSNDHLLQLFEDYNGKSLSQTITHFVSEDWEIRGHFHEEDRNHFIAIEGWEVREASHEENAEGERVQQRFAHRLNQFVSILPSSQNSSHYTPLWIRAQNETHYQRINPNIPEKNLLCLGSLTMKNGTEVLHFYKPASRLLTDDIASPQTERTGKLFLKSDEAVPAKVLDLPIFSAFRNQEKIFVVTTEHLIEVLDAAGKRHLTAITADWINAHLENWWTEIPILVESRVTETVRLITIYGFKDQSSNALAMWYDSKLPSFIFAQLPVSEQNKALSIRYLTHQSGFDFFFCEGKGR